MINIICLKWGDRYSSEYVNNLYSMVKRNLSLPFQFYCLTDDSSEIVDAVTCLPIINDDLNGWWHKLTYFKAPFHDLQGITLTLDLDMVIVDNIDCFFDIDGDFCIEKDYYEENGNNSSIMKFNIGEHGDIYDDFLNLDQSSNDFKRMNNKREKYWGDQAWITEKRPNAVTWPDEWVQSYKWQCLSDEKNFMIPNNCKIVLFHGLPRPHQALEHISKYWR